MNHVSYRAAARRLRIFADQLEDRCRPTNSEERRALTMAVNGTARFARQLFERHRRRRNFGRGRNT